MKKKSTLLTNTEIKIMEILWEEMRPMTGLELTAFAEEDEWQTSYIYNLLTSLQKKGMVEICGVQKCGKQYIRQFLPTVTKEQYAAKMATSLGMSAASVPKVALALAQELDADDHKVIEQLEEILHSFKEKIQRENE